MRTLLKFVSSPECTKMEPVGMSYTGRNLSASTGLWLSCWRVQAAIQKQKDRKLLEINQLVLPNQSLIFQKKRIFVTEGFPDESVSDFILFPAKSCIIHLSKMLIHWGIQLPLQYRF